jgi:hypothetical protein
MDGLALQMLLKDSAVDSAMVNGLCLHAAARELGLDPAALERRNGREREELATEG